MTGPEFDLVITGRYWTAGLASPVEGAIAVRDGVIVDVADDSAAADDLRARASTVILTGEGLLLPGFHDSHVHPVMAGIRAHGCQLHTLDTADEFLAEIARYARGVTGDEWVTGGGWTFAAFDESGPHRSQLDAAVGNRPAAFVVRDEHAIWVSSEALRRAGITATTPDPAGGRIEREAGGEPTGVLHEAAMELINHARPAPTPDDLDRALATAQLILHAQGVTTWQDALVGRFGGIVDVYDAYERAASEGRLTARVIAALFWDPGLGLSQIPGLVARREAASGGKFRATTIKIMQDGIPENHTAALHAPYFDGEGHPTEVTGESLIPAEELERVVSALEDAGFDIHFHTMGDRALTDVLDAIEAATADQQTAFRHQIAHLQSVRPSDISRFAPLEVTANIQALWASHGKQMDDLCIPLLGPERADGQFPFADLVTAGTRLAAGSDWPVSEPSVMHAVHVAVNRVPPGADADEPVFIERQRLSLTDALTAYTAGGAFVNRLENTGAIAIGMLADLTILDRDPFRLHPREIHTAVPRATFVDGTCVWADDENSLPLPPKDTDR